jgi:hypothetical protein
MEANSKGAKLPKETINIIRTTQRNNIELTHIADNKAHVLLSLNAIMVTFLIPLILPNIDIIFEKFLYFPIIILSTTCFTTIYISAIVLKPSKFDNFRDNYDPHRNFSPFFFGNFYKMEPEEFYTYMEETLSNRAMVKQHLAQDLFYVGKRLGFKMTWVRRAFNIFLVGLFLSMASTAVVLFLF